ncbi:uncharacterized protein LOC141846232 [Curcuma longa]|uniref:uncharacterized protein LOC141846232 n=1 Tax=Curcuma longa TaxID=136217 RepID=UPI003D9DD2D8
MPTTRFKKGNKVEVWNRREVPSGSWWSAEIISGNGHTYSVRYDGYPMDSSVAVDRVPRKAIRPRPPPLEDQKELHIGDVVEVFDNNSWKIAEVRMIIGNGYCSMRLLGSSRKFPCHKSRIRRQLSWQDNKWMVIHKDFGEESDRQLSSSMRGGTSICHVPQSCEKMKTSFGDKHFPAVFSGSIKKRPLDMHIHADMCNAGRKKMRAIMKDGIFQQETTENSSKCALKVDFLTSSRRLLGEKYTDCYLNKRVGPSRNESGRSMLRSDKEKNLLNSSVLNAAESTSSSVGSCSVDSSHEECYSQSDHAATSYGFETDSSFSRKGDLQVQIHEFELSAYRSTLKAFYASGPVSWEREAVMTNLRLMLNISNDEHLMEIRNLGQRWRLLNFASIGL